ncbi:CFEM domain-containing protein [Fusarium acuminatum]|uniref:CFEM domain-containing protein n=1 Tax=Fusarium acuminatum TaxID=5515 RepID=A0ABZ2XBJ1_9HYPO
MHSDFGLDDLFTVLSFCCCVPSVAMTIQGTASHGLGRDIWTLDFDGITAFGFFFYLVGVFYFPLVSLLKMAVLFFYLRIFLGLAHKLLWGTIIFNAVYGIIFTFLGVFQCTPISYFWTKWDGEHEGTWYIKLPRTPLSSSDIFSLNINAITWANAAISIALDIWMLAIPLGCLRSLKLHWKKKIGVAAMFIVGTFITIVSIIRLQSLVDFGVSQNTTYDLTDIVMWSTIETHVGVICASMPALRILLVRLVPILGGSSYGSRKHQNYGEQYQDHTLREHTSRGKSISRPKDGGIELQRTFEVQYGDGDEARLVASDCFSIGAGASTRAGTLDEGEQKKASGMAALAGRFNQPEC